MSDPIKQNDQIRMPEACATLTGSAKPTRLISYPNCGRDLVSAAWGGGKVY